MISDQSAQISGFKILCRGFLLLLALAAEPALFAAGPDSPAADERFGVMTHFAQGWDPAMIPQIAAGGIFQVRDELYWDSVEGNKGVFKFPETYDRYLGALDRQKISPLIVLSFENHNYDGGATPYTPEAFAGYARYAVEVLRHCGPQVKAVEIWNEYNGTFNHGPASQDRAHNYGAMLRVVYAAIKRERPDVIVVGGATSGVPLPYWEKLLANGALDHLDALSVHPYRFAQAPEGIEDEIKSLQALVQRYNHGAAKPIWVTEIGWQIRPGSAGGDLKVDEATQARFLVRAFALLLSADVPRIYWYLFRDHEDFTMGLVHRDDARTPKPAYFAYATLIQQLQGAKFLQREATPPDLYSLVFRKPDGKEVRVLWSLTPRTLKLTGANAAVDIAGQPVAPGELAIGESPLFVTGPLRGLPPASPERGQEIANSVREFSGVPGGYWTYGAFQSAAAVFVPLPNYEITDWQAAWSGLFPYLAITAVDQHPSVLNSLPVAAVRRWQSENGGRVRVTGSFRCGVEGDGVGVSIFVNGQMRFRKPLGGGGAVAENFDLVELLPPKSTVDFVVDPGPGANIDHDATAVAVVIRAEP